MQLELYNSLKKHIEDNLPEIKSVRLFNNQFMRENIENPFLYPVVFLQFSNQSFRELSQGVQECNLICTTHLGFESYKDEDTYVLQLKQDLYKVVNRFQNEYFTKFLRVGERQNFDHDNCQVYETDYALKGKDYTDDIRPKIQVTTTQGLIVGFTSSIS
jgi:hypothetical protein